MGAVHISCTRTVLTPRVVELFVLATAFHRSDRLWLACRALFKHRRFQKPQRSSFLPRIAEGDIVAIGIH
jgi:hypothetical protein